MKSALRKVIPESLLLVYHRLAAVLSGLIYRWPTRTLIVVGITGTKGKSTTANFMWAGLTGSGLKVAQTGTANFRIGEHEEMNKWHMTMPGTFVLQRFFRRCVNESVDVVIVETTSEGIKQSRHVGIEYDFLVFTNLTPEHLPSHGSFENYRAAKQEIFRRLSSTHRKKVREQKIPKVVMANADSDESKHFVRFDADRHVTFGVGRAADMRAENVQEHSDGVTFDVEGRHARLNIPGVFNVSNALPVFAIAKELHLPLEGVIKGLTDLAVIPGRMEVLQTEPFVAVVDYAHEKQSMTLAVQAARGMVGESGRVIVLLGAEGGGRDKAKRPVMGEIVANNAELVVVSNVDPYDDDPKPIIDDIADAAVKHGKTDGKDLFRIEDRRAGIRKCLELAGPGDVVLITGKGAEQSMVIGGKSMQWDDRDVVRAELNKIG